MTTIPKNVRVSYIPDTQHEDRALTVVHRLNGDGTVTFGVAINRPTEWVATVKTADYVSLALVKGDKFNKRKGREIALGRLNTALQERAASTKDHTCGVIPLPGGVPPLMACLDFLAVNSTHKHIKRIAMNEAAFMRWNASMLEAERILEESEASA